MLWSKYLQFQTGTKTTNFLRSVSSAYINSVLDPDLTRNEKFVDYEKCHILRSVSGPIFCVITKNPKLD